VTRAFKILIVDDDILTVHIQKKILMSRGYEVFTSNTAVNIFGIVAKYEPDLIIMDHNLPLVSGAEATKQLKANAQTAAIPVIYFSSALDIELLAKLAGSDAYVSKADHGDLIKKVAALLEGK